MVLDCGDVFGTEAIVGAPAKLEVRAGTDCELFALYVEESTDLAQRFPLLLQMVQTFERHQPDDSPSVTPSIMGRTSTSPSVDERVEAATHSESGRSVVDSSNKLAVALRGQQLTLHLVQSNMGELSKRMADLDHKLDVLLPQMLQQMTDSVLTAIPAALGLDTADSSFGKGTRVQFSKSSLETMHGSVSRLGSVERPSSSGGLRRERENSGSLSDPSRRKNGTMRLSGIATPQGAQAPSRRISRSRES